MHCRSERYPSSYTAGLQFSDTMTASHMCVCVCVCSHNSARYFIFIVFVILWFSFIVNLMNEFMISIVRQTATIIMVEMRYPLPLSSTNGGCHHLWCDSIQCGFCGLSTTTADFNFMRVLLLHFRITKMNVQKDAPSFLDLRPPTAASPLKVWFSIWEMRCVFICLFVFGREWWVHLPINH